MRELHRNNIEEGKLIFHRQKASLSTFFDVLHDGVFPTEQRFYIIPRAGGERATREKCFK